MGRLVCYLGNERNIIINVLEYEIFMILMSNIIIGWWWIYYLIISWWKIDWNMNLVKILEWVKFNFEYGFISF